VPCERMGVPPGQTLHVGDNYVTDIAGARDAGLLAIHLDREGSGLQGEIKSLVDLIPMMNPHGIVASFGVQTK
jgi:putative hydrolase of the HAD superfamily